MRISMLRALAAACATTVVVSCGGGGGSTPAPVPAPPPGSAVVLAVERVFPNLTFDAPVAMLQPPGDRTRWFVVEQDGVVRVFANDPAASTADVFVDIRARVASPLDGRGGETGLLGMAFHPQFQSQQPRRVFLAYTALEGGALVLRIAEYRSLDGGQTLDPSPQGERILMTIDQPQDNHNGGNIAFSSGSPPLLFIGVGDGGGANDESPGHSAIGNGQDRTRLLGKMLRIDVTPQVGYNVPPGNPFSGNPQCGVDGTSPGAQNCPEIFAWGFRNPWRWSLDRATGELWVGDVGQATWEEVDRVQVNQNFGWKCREGASDFRPSTCGTPGTLIDPIAQYTRSAGQAITGGFVYRGAAIPSLQGRYVFGDFGSGRIWHIAGDTMATLDVTNATPSAPVLTSNLQISSFGEDNDGELYVVDYRGTLHRLRAQ